MGDLSFMRIRNDITVASVLVALNGMVHIVKRHFYCPLLGEKPVHMQEERTFLNGIRIVCDDGWTNRPPIILWEF